MTTFPVLPSAVIVLPLLAASGMMMVKYYIVNSPRRVTERHFLLALGAVVAMMAYLAMSNRDPADGAMSCAFAAVGLVWLGASYALFRLKPPQPKQVLPFGSVKS